MESCVTNKELKLGPGLHHPVFVGSGAVTFTSNMTNTDLEFQIILNATATCTQMTGPKVKNYNPKSIVVYDKKVNRVLTYYSYPQPSITVTDCIAAIRHVKNLPYPEHLANKKRQRNIILNYDFSELNIDTNSLKKLLVKPKLFYAIELVCTETPKDLKKVNNSIKALKTKFPKSTNIWLKIPPPSNLLETEYLQELTSPDALVLAQRNYAVKTNVEEYDTNKPTLQAGSYTYPSTLATILSCKENIKIPLIVSGGIQNAPHITEALKIGASGVQVTSSICKNWMNIVTIMTKLQKLNKRR